MEYKSKEMQEATEKPSSFTVTPKDNVTRSVINNELRKYFYMQPGKSNTYFELGALYATKDINPIESIITAIQQYYLQLAKDRDEHVEFVNAMFTAINANIKLIQQVDEKLNITTHTESTALIGGVFTKLL